jgi:hypothetical protein
MLNIFFLVLPIFVVLATGNILYKLKFFDENFIATSNRLIFYFLLPVLLFRVISISDIASYSLNTLLLIMFFSILLMFFLSFLLGKVFKFGKKEIGTFAMNSFRANYAYMGLPVCSYAFGENGLTVASILMAFIVPLVNLMSVISLSVSSEQIMNKKSFVKNTLFNPLAIACILGIIFSLMGIKLPEFLMNSLKIISNVTLPLALFCIGATLNPNKIKGNILLISLNVVLKLIILPLIALIFINIVSKDISFEAKILIIMLSSPAATVNYVLASAMGGDRDLASSVIILSSLLSIFSFVFWISFLS